ncbi:MAG TPA: hypothetical protein VFJ53_00740, partial [Solirubrobacterales bacterium]|nr:hypothetical protein [Solirubrobacterales bacterium]
VWTDSSNGSSASGSWTDTKWSNCGSTTVDTLKNGTVSVASGGSVSGAGSEITFSALGTSCVYGTSTGTALGTLKGGTPATMTVSASLPKISGGFLCANPGKMTGSAKVTTPSTLLVD